MKRLSMIVLVLVTLHGSKYAVGQTLTEKLIAEDATRLVQQAREKGNIVRGAILFHQGNINCAKCHRSSAERDRIGPDLSRIDPAVTDEFIVESILQPSKVIKEGYESFNGLTIEGTIFNGMLVRQDDQQIVIRDRLDVDKLITIKRADLDEMRPSELSNMPDKLADELKNHQQFLDLLRYVLDIKERGPESPTTESQIAIRRELTPEMEGFVLLQQHNCGSCHDLNLSHLPIQPKKAPRLGWVISHLNPKYLQNFITDPHGVKPGTVMPDVFAELTAADRATTAEAITHFLLDEFASTFQQPKIDTDSAADGFELFHTVGCVACHSPRDRSANELPISDSQPLGDLAVKYDVRGLTEFLEEPLAVRPSGHMPNMQLKHREAVNIASYLLQQSNGKENSYTVDTGLVEKGRSLFQQYRCVSCHDDSSKLVTEVPKSVGIDSGDFNKGCLSDEIGAWPQINLSELERNQIRMALESGTQDWNDTQKIEMTLRTFNCIACHSRDDLGGVSAERNPHFTTTNLNLGDQGRIPPSLSGVGAKLNRQWMRNVLVNRRTIRPYMNTRMPQYGETNVGHLLDLFSAVDELDPMEYANFEDQKETRKFGLELAGSNGLNCVACHTYKYKLSDTMPAVDLTEMAERLKKPWFYHYMLDPQHFSPNTVMPSFWPKGTAIRKDLKGTAKDQIEALWQYLLDGRQSGTPRGVVREPLEIVVGNETKMLRRSYPGIGKRGIGVGYPGGVNLAFDAEQMRLATLWRGKFVDPGGVWRGQGSGQVRPLGRTIAFAKGPDLDSQSEPWIVDEGRPPNHQFEGYRLDSSQRPTFLYRYDDVQIEDYFVEGDTDESGWRKLRRTITITTNQTENRLRFRVASGVAKQEEDWFVIKDQLKVRLISEHELERSQAPETSDLVVSLDLEPETTTKIIVDYEIK